MSNAVPVTVRKTGSPKAIILIHGYNGDAHLTFGLLPAFLAGNPQLNDWDIHSLGYPTSLAPDISGVWSADPDLSVLAGLLSTAITHTYFPQYSELALVAHSMGGLIAQRAILDGQFLGRVKHVFLFGTPSNGLKKAGFGWLFKRQARDMFFDGPFIASLREQWQNKFSGDLPFQFRAIAGIRDEFVPSWSSVEPFPARYRCYVQGNHLEMVKPRTLDTDSALLICNLLKEPTLAAQSLPSPEAAEVPLANANKIAIQNDQTVRELSSKGELSEDELKTLAFSLEMTGRQEEAIQRLEARHQESTELTGMLAGRLKRRWLADPEGYRQDGERASELYEQAFRTAQQAGDHPQAFYNGINTAFMFLALRGSRYDARSTALEVLEHCRADARLTRQRDKWRLATEGEAQLYLGDLEGALVCYGAALEEYPDARESDSMLQQAIWASRLMHIDTAETRIRALFQSPGQ